MYTAPRRPTGRSEIFPAAVVGFVVGLACLDSPIAAQSPPVDSTGLSPDAVIVSLPGEPVPEPTAFVDCISEGRGLTLCVLEVEAERYRVLERCFDRGSSEAQQVIIRACTFALHNDLLEGRSQADLFVNRADAYFRLKRMSWALADYDRALELWPHLAALHYNRGVYYATAGDFVRARADFDSALRLDPTLAPARRMEARLDGY